MANEDRKALSRRRFLMYLAASPLITTAACSRPEQPLADMSSGDVAGAAGRGLISDPGLALDVFDLKAVARNKLPVAHYGYLATGVDGELTLRANEEAFSAIRLRPRRLVDVSAIDMGTTLFGKRWETPIIMAPAGSQNAFHADGELATARAAKSRNHLQILSSVTTHSVEDVAAAREAPVWYQLYPTSNWEITKTLLRRAEAAGSPVVVLTVDLQVNSNRLTDARARRLDNRNCDECHASGPAAFFDRKPMYDGTGITGFKEFSTPGHTGSSLSGFANSHQ
ncbi:MAG: alpha-hydroxy acid oxidase [Gammaproteobacteria bacterium]